MEEKTSDSNDTMKEQFALWILRWAAKRKLARLKPTTVAVTGSVGKSTFIALLDGLLHDEYRVRTTTKGNSETGLPLEILGIRHELTNYRLVTWLKVLLHALSIGLFGDTDVYNLLIAEFGIDSPFPPKNMSYLLTIIPHPDVAVVLSIAPVHTEQFSALVADKNDEKAILRQIAREKMLLAQAVLPEGLVIVSSDSSYILKELDSVRASVQTVGTKTDDTYRMETVETDLQTGTSFAFNFKGSHYQTVCKEMVFVKDTAQIALCAIAAAHALGNGILQSIHAIEQGTRFPPGRFSKLLGKNNTVLIDGSYNASPSSLKVALEFLKTLKGSKRRRIAVLGDMRELGPLAETSHRTIAKIAAECTDYIVLVGDLMYRYAYPELRRSGFSGNRLAAFTTSERVSDWIASFMQPGDIILVKGSQNTIYLETVVKELLKRPEDRKLLARQSEYWDRIRKRFYETTPWRRYDSENDS